MMISGFSLRVSILPILYTYEDMEKTPIEIVGVAKRFIQDI